MPPVGASGSTRGFTDYTEFQHSEDEGDEESLLAGPLGARDRPVGCRSVLRNLFKLAEVESSYKPHTFSAEEKRKLSRFESIDYLPPNSAVYRKWLARQPHGRHWERWVMMGAIGCTTGLVAYLLYVMIAALAEFKYGATRWLILNTNMGVAWLFNSSYSLALVAASSALVIGWAPAAGGSGVPEVMAYLNGVQIPKVFNIMTVVVKFFSAALAVASGLPVGPEGPMIHIGAALGSALSQGHSTTLGFSTSLFRRFRNPKDKRDFVTAGVAVGVAAAFNAPIGGLLFAFEEVASFWQHSLGWQIFFACMCATLTLNLGRSAGQALLHNGSLGWFNADVAFEAGLEFSAHVLAVLPAALVGLASGLLGICFTVLNLKVCRARDALLTGARWRRMVEPCAMVVLYVTGCMVLPLFFPCTPTQCVVYEGHVYCGGEGGEAGPAPGAAPPPPAGGGVPPAPPAVGPGRPPSAPPLKLPLYTCSSGGGRGAAGGSDSAWIPDSGTITPDSPRAGGNVTTTVYYNELATLLLNSGDDAIKHLMSRGAHRRFGYKALFVLLAWYSLCAALAAGSSISSGLFVPMLLIGACIGRLVGLATTDAAGLHLPGGKWGLSSDTSSDPWSWIDPGAFALVGAGAFMSSLTRLTVALAVIMVELSDDVHMLLPVLVAIMVAKWVADAATHSLYHGLLEAKCVPFLSPEAHSHHSLDLLPVSGVMHSPVVVLRADMAVRELQDALRGNTHNGFPIVRDSSVGQVFIGTISRHHLLALLQRFIAAHPAGGGGGRRLGRVPGQGSNGQNGVMSISELTWQELNRKMMEPVEASSQALEAQMVALHLPHDLEGELAPGLLEEVVDLTPYVNTSAFKVQDNFSVERAYILFRNMGLRHLVVVDQHNRVKGILTRKDLMAFKVEEAMQRALLDADTPRNLGQQHDWLEQASGSGGGAALGTTRLRAPPMASMALPD